MSPRFVRTLIAITLVAALSLTILSQSTPISARSRDQPVISLVAHQCPPGMTEQTLKPAECQEVTEGFDVQIVSIEGTQPTITLADAQLANWVYSWGVEPTESDLDNWGIKQTLLPAGTTSYLVTGASAYVNPAPTYDYRFTTSVDNPFATLDLYIFTNSPDSPVIPAPDSPEESTAAQGVDEAEIENVVETETTPPPAPTATANPTEAAAEVTTGSSSTNQIDEDATEATIEQGPAPVRIAANTNAAIIATLKDGDTVSLLGTPVEIDGMTWHEVRLEDRSTGWIEALNLQGDFQAPVILTPVPAPTKYDPRRTADAVTSGSVAEEAAPVPAEPMGETWYAADSRVMVVDPPMLLRSSPDLGGEVLDVFYEGELLLIGGDAGTSAGHQWFAASRLPTGPAGYIASGFAVTVDFLTGDRVVVGDLAANVRSGPGEATSVVAVQYPASAGTVEGGPDYSSGYAWYEVVFDDGERGWVASSLLVLGTSSSSTAPEAAAEETPWFAPGSSAIVVDPPVNLRAEPGLDGNQIGSLDMGEAITILDEPVWVDGYGWYLVETTAGTGYVAGAFLGPGFAAGTTTTVIDGPISLRRLAGTDADIVTSLPEGVSLFVLASPSTTADGYTWIEVATDEGLTGWVATAFLGS